MVIVELSGLFQQHCGRFLGLAREDRRRAGAQDADFSVATSATVCTSSRMSEARSGSPPEPGWSMTLVRPRSPPMPTSITRL